MAFATDLVELSDCAHNRLRDRLHGIDDAEFAWEPVPGSWTLREQPDGTFAPDGNDESGSHAYAPPPPKSPCCGTCTAPSTTDLSTGSERGSRIRRILCRWTRSASGSGAVAA